MKSMGYSDGQADRIAHQASTYLHIARACRELWRGACSSNWTGALTTLAGQIAVGTGGIVVDGAGYTSSTSSFPFAGLLNTSNSSGGPKAYLNWLVFDKNYVFIPGKSGYQRMSTTAKEAGTDVTHERLASPDILILEPGYVYVYLSNEETTPVEVYFDDFKVTQVKSPVIATDDYYAFGLTFNSYSRENCVPDKFKFQGQENVDDLGLKWDGFKWRNHQPEIGRFFNIDPMAAAFYYNSPYAFSENKVTTYVELEGLEAFFIHGTKSGSDMWTKDLTEFIRRELTTNKSADTKFSWDCMVGFRKRNWLFNDEKDRMKAAKGLMMYVMRKRVVGEKITLVGHSHGGNVAILAAELLWNNYQISVDIVNFNTPAYNDFGDPENPEDNFGINNLTHFWTKQDGVAGGLAGSDKYRAPQPNVKQVMMSGPMDFGWLQSHFMNNVNREEVKKKKPDADKEAAKRSGGAH